MMRLSCWCRCCTARLYMHSMGAMFPAQPLLQTSQGQCLLQAGFGLAFCIAAIMCSVVGATTIATGMPWLHRPCQTLVSCSAGPHALCAYMQPCACCAVSSLSLPVPAPAFHASSEQQTMACTTVLLVPLALSSTVCMTHTMTACCLKFIQLSRAATHAQVSELSRWRHTLWSRTLWTMPTTSLAPSAP